ncbi:metallophosphoesterase [Candidatus Woesearchaeota archaeon]|nr:metallophosphoesterase [Candidatus Woesearchaeota archaeon]
MRITKNVEAIDLALHLSAAKTLVLSDFHLGFEESLNRQGVLVPRMHFKDVMARLEHIFATLKKDKKSVRTVVITGDLKHDFGRIGRQEWRDVTRLVEYLLTKAPRLVLIKGNHDVQLGPIATKRGIELVSEYRIDDVLIIHGDVAPKKLTGIKTIIMGHEHPAITLRSKGRSERYKCFLKGTYQRRTLIVQPSFNLLTEGTDILQEQFLSPLLKGRLFGIRSFEAFIVDDRSHDVLPFGTLQRLK